MNVITRRTFLGEALAAGERNGTGRQGLAKKGSSRDDVHFFRIFL